MLLPGVIEIADRLGGRLTRVVDVVSEAISPYESLTVAVQLTTSVGIAVVLLRSIEAPA